jgi:hypothetical protein
MVLARMLSIALQWSLTSTRLNATMAWAAVTGYEIVLARFSLMRPRWLTSLSALILLTPLVGSVMMVPLAKIFDISRMDLSSLDGPYILERSPWETDASGNTGVELIVFYRPPLFPILRHLVQRASFGNDACRATHASAQVNLPEHTVHFHCPALGSQNLPIDLVLPFR